MDAAARREARRHWRGHVFRSWEEAEEYDVLFWNEIPVQDRARVTWELSEELYGISHPDEPHEPRVHGRPRATKDLDVWVEPNAENAPQVVRALNDFGARALQRALRISPTSPHSRSCKPH